VDLQVHWSPPWGWGVGVGGWGLGGWRGWAAPGGAARSLAFVERREQEAKPVCEKDLERSSELRHFDPLWRLG
jgi:hypothetical protein